MIRLTVSMYAVVTTNPDGCTSIHSVSYGKHLAEHDLSACQEWDPDSTHRIILVDALSGDDVTEDAK